MDEIEDENDEKVEQPQAEAIEINTDQNNVVVLLSNTQNAHRNPTDNTIQKAKKPKVTDAPASNSKRVIMKKDSNSLEHPSTDNNNEVELELDLIVVDEKKTDQSNESNENGQATKTRKRIRLEVEPLISLTNESSQNETKEIKSPSVPVPVPMRSHLLQPRKSIEEIVSSSEAIDTNSEDKYFALSILGTLRRLTPHKRALAKCHILSYLTEIEYGNSNST